MSLVADILPLAPHWALLVAGVLVGMAIAGILTAFFPCRDCQIRANEAARFRRAQRDIQGILRDAHEMVYRRAKR